MTYKELRKYFNENSGILKSGDMMKFLNFIAKVKLNE